MLMSNEFVTLQAFLSYILWLTTVITTQRKLKEEDCRKCKANLRYIVSSDSLGKGKIVSIILKHFFIDKLFSRTANLDTPLTMNGS